MSQYLMTLSKKVEKHMQNWKALKPSGKGCCSTYYRTMPLDSEVVYFKSFSKCLEVLDFERQICHDIQEKPLLAGIGGQSSSRQMVTHQGFFTYPDFFTVLSFHKNE